MEKWQGKVAVVTGATKGIGAAITTELVKAGMVVCGLGTRKDKIEERRAALFGAPGQLNAVECDITDEASVKQAFSWIEKTLGGIDVLINNAAVLSNCLFLDDNNIRDLKLLLDNNITGLCICTREAVKSMRGREVDGHIVNINSVFGHTLNTCVPGTKPINGMYPASKFAITAMTECLRQELMFAETNIKISSVSPGLVNEEIVASDTKNDLIRLMPRLKAEDVANAVLYILSTPEHVQIHDMIIKPMGEFV